MKVYAKVVMDLEGNVLYEDSYEYEGELILCKYGNIRAQKQAAAGAEKSYQLQLAAQTQQQKQLEEAERLAKEEELQKQLALKKGLMNKKAGYLSTILTGGSDLGTPNLKQKSLYS